MKIVVVPPKEEELSTNMQVFDLAVQTLNGVYSPDFKCFVEYRKTDALSAALYRKKKWYCFPYWSKALHFFVTNSGILMSHAVDLDVVILGSQLEKALKENELKCEVVYIDYETNNGKDAKE